MAQTKITMKKKTKRKGGRRLEERGIKGKGDKNRFNHLIALKKQVALPKKRWISLTR